MFWSSTETLSIVQYGIRNFWQSRDRGRWYSGFDGYGKGHCQSKKFAAHLLKADESEVTFENGKFCCVAHVPEKAVAEGVGGAVVESPAASFT